MRCALGNGLPVTGGEDAARAIDAFEHAIVTYNRSLPDIWTSAAVSGDCALGEALAATLHLLALTAEGRAAAAPYVARAQELAPRATEREQTYIAAISAWSAGDVARCRAILDQLLARWPADLISAKVAQFHQINSGDFGAMLRTTTHLVEQLPRNRFVLGMYAFALEQTGHLTEAEKCGRLAAEAGPDPWAHHAVAHVLESMGRPEEGRRWMAQNAAAWDDCSSFMYTHNWWHAALFELALGDTDAALDLFDRRVWGVRRDCCQDQINAVSLLIRFELLGLNVGDRWTDLAPHLERRVGDRANAFIDLHYAYGLARAGRDAAVDRQRRNLWWAARRCGKPLTEAVAVAADGMVAHARGDYARAAACLDATRPSVRAFGGSSTQRRLIDLVHEDSARRANRQ